MRVLVTGGSGFIGSYVTEKLRERGITIRVYDLQEHRYLEDIEYQQGSILDMETLRIAMNGVDAVYHLAAVADVNDVFKDPSYAETINVRGTINVLEAMRHTGLKRLVYGSTTWVYSGVDAEVVDEDTPVGTPDHRWNRHPQRQFHTVMKALFGSKHSSVRSQPWLLRYNSRGSHLPEP